MLYRSQIVQVKMYRFAVKGTINYIHNILTSSKCYQVRLRRNLPTLLQAQERRMESRGNRP